jgi:hypothetical protein
MAQETLRHILLQDIDNEVVPDRARLLALLASSILDGVSLAVIPAAVELHPVMVSFLLRGPLRLTLLQDELILLQLSLALAPSVALLPLPVSLLLALAGREGIVEIDRKVMAFALNPIVRRSPHTFALVTTCHLQGRHRRKGGGW